MAGDFVLGKVSVSGSRSERVFTFTVGGSNFPITLDPEDQQDFREVLNKLSQAAMVIYNGNVLNPSMVMLLQSSDLKNVTNDQVKIRFLSKGTNHEIGSGVFATQEVMELQKRLPAPEVA